MRRETRWKRRDKNKFRRETGDYVAWRPTSPVSENRRVSQATSAPAKITFLCTANAISRRAEKIFLSSRRLQPRRPPFRRLVIQIFLNRAKRTSLSTPPCANLYPKCLLFFYFIFFSFFLSFFLFFFCQGILQKEQTENDVTRNFFHRAHVRGRLWQNVRIKQLLCLRGVRFLRGILLYFVAWNSNFQKDIICIKIKLIDWRKR